jgi:hypothetical protein
MNERRSLFLLTSLGGLLKQTLLYSLPSTSQLMIKPYWQGLLILPVHRQTKQIM